jgi:aspartate aminotransferase-like enzyme
MSFQSFNPPRRILMGPGPSDIAPVVLNAMSRPVIGHLDPLFIGMMDELKQLLQYAFQTENAFTIALSAPGSAGMEACFVNLVEPGDKVIVCVNGVFGGRQLENVKRCGGVPVCVEDEWGRAVIYSGSQKCLSCVPGLSPLSFSANAAEKIKQRKTPVQSWFLDQSLVMQYWSGEGKRACHHTAPVNSLYALHEALVQLHHEGLEQSWERHKIQHQDLAKGLGELGIEFVVPENERLPQLNTIHIPEGVDDAEVRGRLLNDYNLEIGAGLGAFAGKAWRIGLMGYAARNENVTLCLAALKGILDR